jgi:hypothetical protein
MRARQTLFAWRALRFCLTLFNATVLAVLVWLIASFALATSFFDADLPVEKRVNIAARGKYAFGMPKQVDFEYRPDERARALFVIFNFDDFYDDYAAVRFSTIPELPNAFLRYSGGRVVKTQPFGDGVSPSVNDIHLQFDGKKITIWQNDREVFSDYFRLEENLVVFAPYPTYSLPAFRPPWSTIARLKITSVHNDKTVVETRRPVWLQRLLAVLFVVLAGGGYVIGDRLLVGRLARGAGEGRRFARVLATYPTWPLLVVLSVFAAAVAQDQAVRHDVEATWLGSHLVDGRVSADSLRANPTLKKGGEQITVDLSEKVRTIVCFGGSTTHGIPYDRGEYDWPSQLERRIKSEFGETQGKWQVLNLGYKGNYLETNFPPAMEGFLSVLKPEVVIIHSVINEYLKERPWDNIHQSLGYGRHVSPDGPGRLEQFEKQLDEAVKMAGRHSQFVVVVAPPVDRFFFGSDPLADWQQMALSVAAREEAIGIPLQQTFDELENRFVFYEYLHQTRLGYDKIAEAIFGALRPRLERPTAD